MAIRDDGDRDEAAAVVARLGLESDPRVRCDRNERNLGMVANWNASLDAVATPLASLLHADDLLLPGYVRCMRGLAAANAGAAAFFCEARIIDRNGAELFSLADRIIRGRRRKT